MRSAPLALVFAVLAHMPPAHAAPDLPRPPCGAEPVPPFADADRAPTVRVWTAPPRDWAPPTCGAWPDEPVKVATALAGSFRHDGSLDDLLGRFGRVSALAGIRYWSATTKRWRVLITAAHALTAAHAGARRPDFTAEEMRSGAALVYAQDDSGSSGSVVYRMRLHALAADRFVLAIDNVDPVRLVVVPLFDPGALKSLYVVERRSPGVWGYYSLGLVGHGASGLAESYPSSFANRAAALYRHIAGIPTDREPPAAP